MTSYGERGTRSLNCQVEHETLTLTSFAVPRRVRPYLLAAQRLTWV